MVFSSVDNRGRRTRVLLCLQTGVRRNCVVTLDMVIFFSYYSQNYRNYLRLVVYSIHILYIYIYVHPRSNISWGGGGQEEGRHQYQKCILFGQQCKHEILATKTIAIHFPPRIASEREAGYALRERHVTSSVIIIVIIIIIGLNTCL